MKFAYLVLIVFVASCTESSEPGHQITINLIADDSTHKTIQVSEFNHLDTALMVHKHVNYNAKAITIHAQVNTDLNPDSSKVIYYLYVADDHASIDFGSISSGLYQTSINADLGHGAPNFVLKGTFYAFYVDGMSGIPAPPAYFIVTAHDSTFSPSLPSDTLVVSTTNTISPANVVTVPVEDWRPMNRNTYACQIVSKRGSIEGIWNQEASYSSYNGFFIEDKQTLPIDLNYHPATDLRFCFFDFD